MSTLCFPHNATLLFFVDIEIHIDRHITYFIGRSSQYYYFTSKINSEVNKQAKHKSKIVQCTSEFNFYIKVNIFNQNRKARTFIFHHY